MFTKTGGVCLFISMILVSGAIEAAVLPTVYVRASSFNGTNLLPRFAVDGSGVAGDYIHSDYPPETMWQSGGGLAVGEAWFECDLGQICDIATMRIYNYNDKWSQLDYTDKGIQDFRVLLSNDGVSYTAFGGTRTALKAPGIPEDPEEPRDNHCATVFDLTGARARYVRIDVISNYGGTTVGMSEIVFEGNSTGMGENVPSADITATSSDTVLPYYDPQNVVNGSGFAAGGYGAHYYTDWSQGPNGWIGYMNGGIATLLFTFNEPKNLVSARIWNMDSWFGQGDHAAKDFELHVSSDGVNFSPALIGQLNPYVNSVIHDYSLSFPLAAGNVTAVKMVITSTYAGASPSTGINEIQFVQGGDFYDLVSLAGLAATWRLADGQSGYDDAWDLVDDGVIDLDDLRAFCESWLTVQ